MALNQNTPRNNLDTKVPLTWVIGAAVTVIVAFSVNTYKVDMLVKAVEKIETKADTRDDKINTLTQSIIQQQSQTSRNTEDIGEIKRDVNQLKLQRWSK